MFKKLISCIIVFVFLSTGISSITVSANGFNENSVDEGIGYVPGQLIVGLNDGTYITRNDIDSFNAMADSSTASTQHRLSDSLFLGVDVLSAKDLTDVSDFMDEKTINMARSKNASTSMDVLRNKPRKNLRQILLIDIANDSKNDMLAAIEILKQNPLIAYAEPNIIGAPCSIPNDPFFLSDNLWGIEKIKAPEAWEITTGSHSVLVGVMDTGVDYTHSDLANNVDLTLGRNFSPGYNFFDPMDDGSHGTHVAGTIGGVGNNGEGVVGVNWDVTIVPLKIWQYGNGTEAELIQALAYSELIGIPVLNLSGRWNRWGWPQTDFQAMYEAVESYSGLLIAAAGNEDANNDTDYYFAAYPSSFDLENIISVGATTLESNGDERRAIAGDFGWSWNASNYGSNSVHLFAPGTNILSTVPTNINSTGYHAMSGTSMAAPHVAGVAALIKSHYPELSTAQLKQAILEGVDEIPALNGLCVTGGRLNAKGALDKATQIIAANSIYLSPWNPTATGTLSAGDVHWYSISPNDIGFYTFTTTGTTDTYGELYLNGKLIASNDNGGTGDNFLIKHKLLPWTTYHLKVRGADTSPTTGTTGDYTLSMQEQYIWFSLATTITDTLNAGEENIYVFFSSAPGYYTITVDCSVNLIGEMYYGGAFIDQGNSGGQNQGFSFTVYLDESYSYRLLIKGENDYVSGSFTVSAAEVPWPTPTYLYGQSGSGSGITGGGSFVIYDFEAWRGGYYLVSVSGGNANLIVHIYDGSNRVYIGYGKNISFTHYLSYGRNFRIHIYAAKASESGAYNLSIGL
ncbi:MAG: S8 family serine peptidase [Oscillospiraceae bacterium]|nr:S8 family serine peptidase [Oscillospiraceae bacterium]